MNKNSVTINQKPSVYTFSTITTVHFILMLLSANRGKTPVYSTQLPYLHGFTETCRRDNFTAECVQHIALDCATRELCFALQKTNICWIPNHKDINFIHSRDQRNWNL